MKNFLVSLLALALVLVACNKTPVVDNNNPILGDSNCAEISTDKVVKNENLFGFELLETINNAEPDDKNLFISPLSIGVALSMTQNGAVGNTKAQMKEMLHFEDISDDDLNDSYYCLINGLEDADERVNTQIANSIWYKEGAPVKSEFLETNQLFYDSEVFEHDFSNPNTIDIINGWVGDKTENLITDVLDYIPGDIFMYIINAIYFKGTWQYEFDAENTINQAFYLNDAEFTECEMMKQQAEFLYKQTDDYQAIELPYGQGDFVMNVFLPYNNYDVNDLIIDLQDWEAMKSDFEKEDVVVSLPKFKIEYKRTINQELITLGMKDAFSGSADLTGIADASLMISRVIHQSFVEVDEAGTEAAAVTVVEVVETSAGVDLPTYFTANRPFVFVIREKSSDTIMFVGKVMNPAS